MKRRCLDIGKSKPASTFVIEDASLEKTKGSSEDALSCGDVNSFKSSDGRDASVREIASDQSEDKGQATDDHCANEAKDPPNLFRPVARVSAFSLYSPLATSASGYLLSRPVPTCSSLIQSSTPESMLYELLNGIGGEPQVPSQCGYGCCNHKNNAGNHKGSLLGPAFVEFVDPPPVPSHELASIAKDLSSIAWLKSGLESRNIRILES